MANGGRTDGLQQGLEARFAQLKHRLLLERLNGTPEPETHALIIQQANEAARIAWLSSYPLLWFPCLFEERAAAVAEEMRLEAYRYWNGLRPAGVGHAGLVGSRPSPQGSEDWNKLATRDWSSRAHAR